MANYLTPGVYVEEDLSPKGGSGYGDARAIACFVGTASRGPAIPTLVTSWTQYTDTYGGFAGNSLLPYSVWLYFLNGGSRCYIIRAARSDSVAATGKLVDSTSSSATPAGPLDAFTIRALAPGAWGNALSVQVVPTGAPNARFHLVVRESGVEIERFEDLSSDPDDSRYIISIVNSPVFGSKIVRLTNLKASSTYVYAPSTDIIPAQIGNLGTGADGTAPYDLVTAAKLLADVDDNIDLNLPGITSASTINAVIDWAATTGKVFVVVDGPKAAESATNTQVLAGYTAMVTGSTPLSASSYGAIYGPWLMCSDPSTSLYGAVRMLPPGGAILGKFARNDTLRHVGKAPAGIETRLSGVLATEARFTQAQLDIAGENHVNIIRNVPGHGICIMGSRGLKKELPDRYVPVRRLLILLRKQLSDITKFAVFEPNGPELWTQLNLVLTKYLSILRKAGVLAGQTDAQAFFVKCDADNNPQASINAGRVVVDVGINFKYPAEFVIIRIGHYQGGASTADESIPGITGSAF